ncbi:hypothetical protein CH063_01603 [Colletotrichum higginsianum]|uniref:C2H2-type domain-containing protein n=1 Tax=Colletotrichum higginsianum (strain IMI 349063) TaxID=759273 RepID=H1V9Q1_COLHI|nr:hypothetical protein CH063_01603 [Colletotrichum higginsianum]
MSDSSVDRHTCAICGKQYQRSAHLRRHESTRECNGGFLPLFVSWPTLSCFSCIVGFLYFYVENCAISLQVLLSSVPISFILIFHILEKACPCHEHPHLVLSFDLFFLSIY